MLEYFDNYNKKQHDNKLVAASYFCYKSYENTIGQAADGFFIKLGLLNKFEDYYNIIKEYDYINYHDDYYISYYFHLKQIPISFIKPPYNSLIYVQGASSNINSLVSMKDKYSRDNLNNKLNETLSRLNNEGYFDDIIHN